MIEQVPDSLPQEAMVFQIKTSKQLLRSVSYQRLMDDIKDITLQEEYVMDHLYAELVRKFAEYVQQLPQPHINNPDSMLRSAVRRAFIMLRAFAQDQQAAHGKYYPKTESGSRVLYAVFSAALLFEVGKICTDRKVVLCDEKGNYHCDWDYFNKPILAQGEYYKIRYGNNLASNLVTEVTHLLAKQIMPAEGFSWLAEDNVLLKLWFIALIARDEFFGECKITLDVEQILATANIELEECDQDGFVPEENLDAEYFWEWLRDKISNEREKINQKGSGIYLVDGELVLDYKQLVRDFGRNYARFSTGMILDSQICNIGVVPLDGQDLRFKIYHQLHSSRGASMFAAATAEKTPPQNQSYLALDMHSTRFYLGDSSNIKQDSGLVSTKSQNSSQVEARTQKRFHQRGRK